MNFFKKLLLKLDTYDATPFENEPNIRFGRYSDSFKNEAQIKNWNAAIDYFKKKETIKSYTTFLDYLGDESIKNVSYKLNEEKDKVDFEILQGSKKVVGTADKNTVTAHVKVVKFKNTNVAFMRKLMEKNYQLRYSRFAIKDNTVYQLFKTSAIDASPEKLYYALKEIAVQSDKIDDLLVNEFSVLESIDNAHIVALTEEQKQFKIKWLRKYITDSINDAAQLTVGKYDGDIGYTLLSTAFKLDYLLTPEGKVMEAIEDIQREYFNRYDNKSAQQKNEVIIGKLKEILDFSDEELSKELYKTKSTFGLGTPTNHSVVRDMIKDVGNAIKQNLDFGDTDESRLKVAKAQIEYVVAYILFFYGVQKPTQRYLEFLMQMLNLDFYEDLNFENIYTNKDGTLNKNMIENKITHINKSFGGEYSNINLKVSEIKFTSLRDFAYSYLKAIENLTYPNQ